MNFSINPPKTLSSTLTIRSSSKRIFSVLRKRCLSARMTHLILGRFVLKCAKRSCQKTKTDGIQFHSYLEHVFIYHSYRYHPHPRLLPSPASHVFIRGAEEERYCVVDITRLLRGNGEATILEEVEISRAIFELYEGGVVGRLFYCY